MPEFSPSPTTSGSTTSDPLASATFTNRDSPSPRSRPVGDLLDRHLPAAGLTAAAALFRARSWRQLRLAAPALLGYLGAMGLLVNFLSLLARRPAPADFIELLLIVVWVAAIGVTIRRLFWVNTDDLPRRPTKVLWVVVLVALLHPLAIALGRRIFAPELRSAVAELQPAAGRPVERSADRSGDDPGLPQRCCRGVGRLGLVHDGAAVAADPYALEAPLQRPVRGPLRTNEW